MCVLAGSCFYLLALTLKHTKDKTSSLMPRMRTSLVETETEVKGCSQRLVRQIYLYIFTYLYTFSWACLCLSVLYTVSDLSKYSGKWWLIGHVSLCVCVCVVEHKVVRSSPLPERIRHSPPPSGNKCVPVGLLTAQVEMTRQWVCEFMCVCVNLCVCYLLLKSDRWTNAHWCCLFLHVNVKQRRLSGPRQLSEMLSDRRTCKHTLTQNWQYVCVTQVYRAILDIAVRYQGWLNIQSY